MASASRRGRQGQPSHERGSISVHQLETQSALCVCCSKMLDLSQGSVLLKLCKHRICCQCGLELFATRKVDEFAKCPMPSCGAEIEAHVYEISKDIRNTGDLMSSEFELSSSEEIWHRQKVRDVYNDPDQYKDPCRKFLLEHSAPHERKGKGFIHVCICEKDDGCTTHIQCNFDLRRDSSYEGDFVQSEEHRIALCAIFKQLHQVL
jgi:hypothetical protein